jgi:hypothetical protein
LSWLQSLLGGIGRDASAMTAPASGLYFWRVAYEEFTFAGSGESCSPSRTSCRVSLSGGVGNVRNGYWDRPRYGYDPHL